MAHPLPYPLNRSLMGHRTPSDVPRPPFAPLSISPLQDDWLRRAELAVQKGEDELAKEVRRILRRIGSDT